MRNCLPGLHSVRGARLPRRVCGLDKGCNYIYVATHWTWDQNKAAANRVKHRLSFETAVHVFDDPFHASKPDPHPDGDRWHTIGLVGPVLLLVVHTWPEAELEGEELVGRIISARKATARERNAYEEGSF